MALAARLVTPGSSCRNDRPRRRVAAFGFVFALLVLSAGFARAQSAGVAQPSDKPEARGLPAGLLAPGHGWMTIRDDRDQSTILLHLPPRGVGTDDWGTVRIAPGVAQQIDAIASEGNRVWMALTPERGASGMLRRMVTISAEPSIGGAWHYPPGRPEVLPPLPGRDELVGFAGTPRGPVALTRSRSESGGQSSVQDWSLHILVAGAWRSLSLPWPSDEDLPAAGTTIRLVRKAPAAAQTPSVDAGGVRIMIFPPAAGAYSVLTAAIPASVADSAATQPLTLQWSKETWPVTGLSRPDNSILAPDAVFDVTDGRTAQLVAASWLDGGSLELVALRPSGASLMRSIEGVPREHRIAPVDGTASVAVLWWEIAGRDRGTGDAGSTARDPVPGSTAARRFTIVEVSALSGKEFYRGTAESGGLISGSEFKILAIALLLLTTVVLLFALRAEPTASLQLPGRFAPADPLRRIFAAAADLVPGILIAAFSMGLEPEAMLSPAIFVGPSAEPGSWLLALAFTIVHCTLGEAMTGRSLGKALAGCEVASMRRDPQTGKIDLGPVRAWQALVRNLIRWGVPVLGILLLIDGGRRHPADAAARTVVVIRLEEDEDEE